MDIHVLFFIVGLFNFIQADGRLIQKNKTKTVEEVHSEKPNPVIRLTRDVSSDSRVGYTKEKSAQSAEIIKVYNRRARQVDEEPTVSPKLDKVKRITRSGAKRRDSKQNLKEKTSTTTTINEPKDEVKTKPLVKKPIPKFKEADYDDFQSMISKDHIVADSGDREDDDFNVSDYDFDINHDEYASGGKHYVPRIRTKNLSNEKFKKNTLRNVEDSDIKTKSTSNKKERSVEDPKKVDQSRDTDYYDEAYDATIKGQSKDSSREAQDDQNSDENDHKISNKTKPLIRKERSADLRYGFI